jgi:hypothetical protein
MTRNAKLFFLHDKDWKSLAEMITNHTNHSLKHDLTIFQYIHASSEGQNYSILSLSQKMDEILTDYGAVEASEKDLLRNSIQQYNGDPLFGDKSNLIYLAKVQ